MAQNPYILFISQRSPFARRIRLLMYRLGLPFEVKTLDVFQDNPELNQANPLGLVPTLVTPKYEAITDSNNILEYLHELTGNVWAPRLEDRTDERQASVWCAGIMQSSVLYFQEAVLHEVPSRRWENEHCQSILDTTEHLLKLNPKVWSFGDTLTQSGWDLCVALEYAHFRVPQLELRDRFRSLFSYLEIALAHAEYAQTQPK